MMNDFINKMGEYWSQLSFDKLGDIDLPSQCSDTFQQRIVFLPFYRFPDYLYVAQEAFADAYHLRYVVFHLFLL